MNNDKIPNYKVGDKNMDGIKIDHIIHKNENVIVFSDENERLHYEYVNIAYKPKEVIKKYSSLLCCISKDYSTDIYKDLQFELACTLFCALTSEDEPKGLEYFKAIEEKIEHAKTVEEYTVYFIILSIIYTILISVICIIGYNIFFKSNNVINILYASISGSVGACLSIIQRNNNLKLNSLSKNTYFHLQSVIKIIVGCLSGIILVFASNAGIILSILKDNNYAIVTFSIMAGFSERFIPEIIKKLEKESY